MPDKPEHTPGKRESRLGLVPPARSGVRSGARRPAGLGAAKPEPGGASAAAGAAEHADTAEQRTGTTGRPRPRPKPSQPRPRSKPRFKLTRRATILALALCAVVVTIAYPLQEYLAQRSQLDSINRQNADLSGQVTSLQAQIALWNDPGYVQIQARARLHYVKPGEEGFTVPGPANGTEQLGLPTPSATPWYDKVWNSVKSPSAQGMVGGG